MPPSTEESLGFGFRYLLWQANVITIEEALRPAADDEQLCLAEVLRSASKLATEPHTGFGLYMVWGECFARDQALAPKQKTAREFAVRISTYAGVPLPDPGQQWTPDRVAREWRRLVGDS